MENPDPDQLIEFFRNTEQLSCIKSPTLRAANNISDVALRRLVVLDTTCVGVPCLCGETAFC